MITNTSKIFIIIVGILFFLLIPSVQAQTSMSAFFAPSKDSGANLPDNKIYPRGRLFPISLFSVGGVSGKIKPDIKAALDQVKKDGFTMIGPQYELNKRILKDAKSINLKAIYTLNPHDTNGKIINKKDLKKYGKQAIKSITQQVKYVVNSTLNKYVAWWYVKPEELRYWKKDEINYLCNAYSAIKKADPQHRPVWMYDPNNRSATALSHTATCLDIVGKGMYVNYIHMNRQRVWCRWTIDQEVKGIAKTHPNAVPIAVPEMFQQPKPEQVKLVPRWVRHDTYGALIAGAKGVVIFSMRERPKFKAHDTYYNAYAKIARNLTGKRHLGRVFLFGEKRHQIKVNVTDGPKKVDMVYHKKTTTYPTLNFLDVAYHNKRYLFVVNGANKNVNAQISGLPNGYIQVDPILSEADKFTINDGKFSISLSPLGVQGFEFKKK